MEKQKPWFNSLESFAMRKNVDPELAEILLAISRAPAPVPCPRCGSRECGPVRCRFENTG